MTASEPKYFYRLALQGLPYGALTMDATGRGVGAQQAGADPLLEASLGVPDSRSAGVRQRVHQITAPLAPPPECAGGWVTGFMGNMTFRAENVDKTLIAVEGLGAKRLASVLTRCTRTPAASCSSTGALLAPPHPPCAGAGRAAASVLAPQVIITAIYQLAVCGLNSGVVPGCSSIRRFSKGWACHVLLCMLRMRG